MYLLLNLDSIYHMWLPLSLDYLPLNVKFPTLEADMDAEAMALRCK